MRAVQFAEYGDPGVLRVAEVPEPHPGPGQIRVAVHAIGVNPFDWKVRSGAMREVMPVDLPRIPGSDVAGTVDEIGAGVTGVAIGDEVFGFTVGGATAEYALLARYTKKPAGMSWAEAAGLPVPVETAVRTLDLLGVRGGTLLVNGAAGAVGLAAIQLAQVRGAAVIGTASPSNHDYLRSLGASPTTYGPGLVDRVRELAPAGVDAALDTAGRGALPDLVTLTGSPDRVVTTADGRAAELGVRFSTAAEGRSYQALDEVATLFEQGRFTLPVAQTFGLDEAARAHEISQAGHVRGKLVLLTDR